MGRSIRGALDGVKRRLSSAQISDKPVINASGTKESQGIEEALDQAEASALAIARKNGRVTKKELMEEIGIGRTKATRALKKLAEQGLLVWVGKNTNDAAKKAQEKAVLDDVLEHCRHIGGYRKKQAAKLAGEIGSEHKRPDLAIVRENGSAIGLEHFMVDHHVDYG